MNRRVLQIVALLLLALMGVAVAHELLPHHSSVEGHEGDSCALCVLLAFTVVLVLAVLEPDAPAASAALLPHAVSVRTPAFRRIRHPRSPPPPHF